MPSKRNGHVSKAVKLALMAGSLPLVASQSALAQEGEDEAVELEEITVTGSRIPARNLISSSPVTTVGSEEITFQGVTRVEDMLNRLPQVYAGQSSTQANAATTTATVDLRGLGQERTLVLINGRRMPAGSPIQGGIGADLNQIPSALVDRVEVLTGGASATYGSDAVAGVVNFITKSDFEGFAFDYQYSFFQSANDDSFVLGLSEDAGFDVPDTDVTDGFTTDVSIMIGANTADGRGNVTLYANYRETDTVLSGYRDWNNCALDGDEGDYSCGGSSTLPQGRFTDFGLTLNPDCVMVAAPTPEDPDAMTCNLIPAFDFETGEATGEMDDDGNLVLQPEPVLPWIGNTSGNGTDVWPSSFDYIVAGTDFQVRDGELYNYQPPNHLQRPDERRTVGAIGHYNISDAFEVYAEVSFMDDKSNAQIAPSGAFFITNELPCGNPLLSEQQFNVLCDAYNLGVDDSQDVYIGRRNVEGGFRQNDIRHTSSRIVFGTRGEINDAWSYDVHGNFGRVTVSQTYLNDLSITNITRALNVIDDPRDSDGDGQPDGGAVCQSVVDGSDPNCLPWNVFETGGVQEGDPALAYLVRPLFATGFTEQNIGSGFVTGDLGAYGVKLPSADTGIQLVGGYEYRQEKLRYDPDQGFTSGDGAGQGGATPPVEGSFAVKEFFFEAQVPLFEGYNLAQSVNLNLGYRYSDYNTDKTTDTYKGAFDWSFNDSIRVRGSFQRAVRAGNLRELFQPQGLNLFDMPNDPCGPEREYSQQACTDFSGLPAALYGTPGLDSPANQYNFLQGGNPNVRPEESDTVSFGGIWSPTFVDGLTVSIDYFNIEVTEAIDTVPQTFTLNSCLESGDPTFCDNVRRAPGSGSLWAGTAGFIVGTNVNIGKFEREGIDLQIGYTTPIGNAGDLDFSLIGTSLLTADTQPTPNSPVVECKGLWGHQDCTDGAFAEWQHTFRTTWATPWDLDLSLFWRYMSAVDDESTTGANWDAYSWLDLAGTWQVHETTQLRLGINNVTDEDPPLSSNAGIVPGNGNGWPSVYDGLGRYIFMGISVEL
jgi:outer membrane receptor protein involved in Fe transport